MACQMWLAMATIVLLMAVSIPTTDYLVKRMPDEDDLVIVIGAGLAGLTAARTLKDQGFNVIVLEAQERIGMAQSIFESKQRGVSADKRRGI